MCIRDRRIAFISQSGCKPDYGRFADSKLCAEFRRRHKSRLIVVLHNISRNRLMEMCIRDSFTPKQNPALFASKTSIFSSFLRTLFLRMSSLCQVYADTNPAIQKFYFSISSSLLILSSLFPRRFPESGQQPLRSKGRRYPEALRRPCLLYTSRCV